MSGSTPDPRLGRVREVLERALFRLGAPSDPHFLAELLWLASVGRECAPVAAGGKGAPGESAADGGGARTGDAVERGAGGAGEVGKPGEGAGKPALEAAERSAGEGESESGDSRRRPGSPAVAPIPLGRTLSDGLSLVRALRPLRVRADGPPGERVDEAATVRRITEERVWDPVRLPRRAPAWRATVVVDAAPSMRLWEGRVGEVARVIRQLGAFQGVRWMHLSRDEAALRPGPPAGMRTSLPPDASPPGTRQVVLVVTDGLDVRWQDGRAATALEGPLSRGVVTFLQLLPADLWPRTRLGRARSPVVIRGGRIAPPQRLPWEKGAAAGRPGLLLDLEAGPLAMWSRMVVRGAGGWRGGVVLKGSGVVGTVAVADGEERARRFLASSRPTARRLAALLSLASEVDQVLVQVVREAALPGAGFGVEAEVLLGGILDPVPGTRRLRFLPEARRALAPELRGGDAPRLYELLGRWLRTQKDVPASVAQVLAAPESAAAVSLNLADPLVRALVEGMRLAGGAWGEVAEAAQPAFTEADEAEWRARWQAWVGGDANGPPEPPAPLTAREAHAVRRRRPGGLTFPLDRWAEVALELAVLEVAPAAASDRREAEEVARGRVVWGLVDRLAHSDGSEEQVTLLGAAWWEGVLARRIEGDPTIADLEGVLRFWGGTEAASVGVESADTGFARPSAAAVRRLQAVLASSPSAAPAGAPRRVLTFRLVFGDAELAPELVPAMEEAIVAAGHAVAVDDPRRQGPPPRPDVYVAFGELPAGWIEVDPSSAVMLTFPGTRPDGPNPDRDDWAGGDMHFRHGSMLVAARSFSAAEKARLVVDLAEIESSPELVRAEQRLLDALARFGERRPIASQADPGEGSDAMAAGIATELRRAPVLGSGLGWFLLRDHASLPHIAELDVAAVACGERVLPWLREVWVEEVTHDPRTTGGRGNAVLRLVVPAAGPNFERWAAEARRVALDERGRLDAVAFEAILRLNSISDADITPDPQRVNVNRLELLYRVLALEERSNGSQWLPEALAGEARLVQGEEGPSADRWKALVQAIGSLPPGEAKVPTWAAAIALEWRLQDVQREDVRALLHEARTRWAADSWLTTVLALAAGRYVEALAAAPPPPSSRRGPGDDAVSAALGHLAAEPPLDARVLLDTPAVEPVALGSALVRTQDLMEATALLGRLAWPPPSDPAAARRAVTLARVAGETAKRYSDGAPPLGMECARALSALTRDPAGQGHLGEADRRSLGQALASLTPMVMRASRVSSEVPAADVLGLTETTRGQLGELATTLLSGDHGPIVFLVALGSGDGLASWLAFTRRSVSAALYPTTADGMKVSWSTPVHPRPHIAADRGTLHVGEHLVPYDVSRHPDPEHLVRRVTERWEMLERPATA